MRERIKNEEFRLQQTMSANADVVSLVLSKDGVVLISADIKGKIEVRRKDLDGKFQLAQTIAAEGENSLYNVTLHGDENELFAASHV